MAVCLLIAGGITEKVAKLEVAQEFGRSPGQLKHAMLDFRAECEAKIETTEDLDALWTLTCSVLKFSVVNVK